MNDYSYKIKICAYWVLGLGIVGSLMNAIIKWVMSEEFGEVYVPLGFATLFIGIGVTVFVYYLLCGFSQIVYNTEQIKNSTVTNNKSNTILSGVDTTPIFRENTNTQTLDNSWRCRNCNKINPNYVGTCVCGNSKYDN